MAYDIVDPKEQILKGYAECVKRWHDGQFWIDHGKGIQAEAEAAANDLAAAARVTTCTTILCANIRRCALAPSWRRASRIRFGRLRISLTWLKRPKASAMMFCGMARKGTAWQGMARQG